MNVREYLADAQAKVSTETFKPSVDDDDTRAFTVTMKLATKPELNELLKSCSTKSWEKLPNGQREWKEIVVPERLREKMADRVIEWTGLTFGLLADLGNLTTPNGDKATWATKPVPCTKENVVALFEVALGVEDWFLAKMSSLADALGRQEAREKNASGTTPPASSDS